MDSTERQTRREQVATYLTALRQKRLELLSGAQSYSIGSRSLARYNIDLKRLSDEIAKVERELAALDGHPTAMMRRAYFKDV